MVDLRKMTDKRWMPVTIMAAAILVFVLLVLTKSHPRPDTVAERVWSVSVVPVTLADHKPNVVLYGTVESPKDSTLKAAVEADVWQTPVREGQAITKGQLIIQLDPRDAELDVQQRYGEVKNLEAQIAAEKLRNETDRTALKDEQRLYKLAQVSLQRQVKLRQYTSKEAVDKAREEVHRRQLDITNRQRSIRDHENRLAGLHAQLIREVSLQKQAQLDLERTHIVSPFTGRLGKLLVAVGDRVRPGDDLAQVYDTSDLEVRAEIQSQYLPQVRLALSSGKPLYANAEFDGQTIRLKLQRLSSTVSRGRSGVDGLFHLTKVNNQLELGRTLRLILHLPQQTRAVELPSEALYGLDRIYIVKDQRLVAIPVERLGSITKPDGQINVLVSSPKLQTGDLVVTTQLPNAVSGLKVKVTK